MSEIIGKVSGWIGTSVPWGAPLLKIAQHVAENHCGMEASSREAQEFGLRFVKANTGANKPALPKFFGYHMVRCRRLKARPKPLSPPVEQVPRKDRGTKVLDGGVPIPDMRQVSPDLKAIKPDLAPLRSDQKPLLPDLSLDKSRPRRSPPRVRRPRAKRPVQNKPDARKPPTKKATETLPGM